MTDRNKPTFPRSYWSSPYESDPLFTSEEWERATRKRKID